MPMRQPWIARKHDPLLLLISQRTWSLPYKLSIRGPHEEQEADDVKFWIFKLCRERHYLVSVHS